MGVTAPLFEAIDKANGDICSVLEELAIAFEAYAKVNDTILDIERKNITRILFETKFRIMDVREFITKTTPTFDELSAYADRALEQPLR